MQKALDGDIVTGPARPFTTNRLEIVVAPGNPKRIARLADLARSDLVFVSEAPAVPAGKYAAQVLAAAGVKVDARSQEADVKAVVSKVALGEADAGIVYITDVIAAGTRVSGVAIPRNQNVVATYPIAVARAAHNRAAADAFITFLLSSDGQKLLQGFGFTPA
jgi:molybdate transport system substrate-binding protein